MVRRKFLKVLTVAGFGSLAVLRATASAKTTTVTFRVQGFTCVTCAVGLDTLLKREKGVAESHSIYPAGKVAVTFDPEQISERTIINLISDMGFHVVDEKPASRA